MFKVFGRGRCITDPAEERSVPLRLGHNTGLVIVESGCHGDQSSVGESECELVGLHIGLLPAAEASEGYVRLILHNRVCGDVRARALEGCGDIADVSMQRKK